MRDLVPERAEPRRANQLHRSRSFRLVRDALEGLTPSEIARYVKFQLARMMRRAPKSRWYARPRFNSPESLDENDEYP